MKLRQKVVAARIKDNGWAAGIKTCACSSHYVAAPQIKLASAAHLSHLFVLRMTQIGQTRMIAHFHHHHRRHWDCFGNCSFLSTG